MQCLFFTVEFLWRGCGTRLVTLFHSFLSNGDDVMKQAKAFYKPHYMSRSEENKKKNFMKIYSIR